MSALVIPIDSFPKATPRQWEREIEATAFSKALYLVKMLVRSSPSERRTAIERWLTAGTVSEAEKFLLYEFYGMGAP